MLLKDHYRVLGLKPSATIIEIKKAYRRLALELHPDKTNGDTYAKERFNAVKEAYEVLTSPARREQYLQQRWYQQSQGRKRTAGIITPETVLQQSLELDRYIRTLDIHRMDRQGLYDHILGILDPGTIEKLNEFNDTMVNSEITMTLLRCSEALDELQEKEVLKRLARIHCNEKALAAMDRFTSQRKTIHRWEKYKIWVVLFLVILLTLLIVLAGN